MGADLLAAAVWTQGGSFTPDWMAGVVAAERLSQEGLAALQDYRPHLAEDDDAVQRTREHAEACVGTMRDHFEGFTRELVSFDSPDGRWTCWLTGGMSWGDSPSDLWDAMNDLSVLPEVLAAIGFVPGPTMVEPHSCDRCSTVYDEAGGDGYAGLCPSCADADQRNAEAAG